MTISILKTYALDIANKAHRAVDAHERGDTEAALSLLDDLKALHQELHYKIWREHHVSGTIKEKGE